MDCDRFDKSELKGMMSRGFSPMMMDWEREEHRRYITACLVKATCVMQNDMSERRKNALAPAWYESIHFRLIDTLKEEKSIFGAIYERVPQAGKLSHPSAPRYVVAFRGMSWNRVMLQDTHFNFKILGNTIPKSKRSMRSRPAVLKLLSQGCVVWLTGHSQGAALALDVGRAMMLDHGFNVPTFLFNPPQVSLAPAIDWLREMAKRDIYTMSYFKKASLGSTPALTPYRRHMEELFERLSPWKPVLYVHTADIVCQGFVDYFEQRQQIEGCFSGVARTAMTLSYRDMLFFLLGKNKERPHLLPSATLCKNSRKDGDVHDLQQWWKRAVALSFKDYKYLIGV